MIIHGNKYIGDSTAAHLVVVFQRFLRVTIDSFDPRKCSDARAGRETYQAAPLFGQGWHERGLCTGRRLHPLKRAKTIFIAST